MTFYGEGFFQKLSKLDKGERAALKRSAGIMLEEADGKALAAFYRCRPPKENEDIWFAVACLRCLWDADVGGGEPLEKIIAKLCENKLISKSVRHRVEVLMDMEWDDDGYMLAKLTRLIQVVRQKSDGASIDFAGLHWDLSKWSDDQKVRRRWAREIYKADNED